MTTRTVCALCLLTLPLLAQTDAVFLRTSFRRLDADGDGMLLRKEFPGSDRQFQSLDRDKDGKATFDEFQGSEVGKALLRARYRNQQEPHARVTAAELGPLRLQWLARCDLNRDGKVTRAEWNGSEIAFLQLDLDDNGVLDRRDRIEAEAQATPLPTLPEPKGEVPQWEDLLRRHDKDGDGRLAGRELADPWLAAARPWADKDGDLALSADELRDLVYAVQQRRAEAYADQQRPEPYEVPFDAWDQDRDGRIRSNEWQGPRGLFDQIDLDRDAAVAREEVQRYRRRVTGKDFVERFDLDGDGKVTLAEFGGPPAAFARADRSGDGTVSRADG